MSVPPQVPLSAYNFLYQTNYFYGPAVSGNSFNDITLWDPSLSAVSPLSGYLYDQSERIKYGRVPPIYSVVLRESFVIDSGIGSYGYFTRTGNVSAVPSTLLALSDYISLSSTYDTLVGTLTGDYVWQKEVYYIRQKPAPDLS